MTLIATLIANPLRPAITDAVLAEARRVLRTEHQPRVLHGEVAAEILVDAARDRQPALTMDLRRVFEGEQFDIAVLPADAHRRKRLLLADMDSTMIEQECIDELAGTLGLKAHVAAITERAMRGETAFEPALRERVALLKDLPLSVVDDVIRDRISVMPGAEALVRTMRAHGAYTCLVSGGFTLFTGTIGARIGFDETHANRLGIHAGALTGTVEEPIVGMEAKRQALIAQRTRLGLGTNETLAVGDGANDLAMLSEAGLGVAYRAKPRIAEAAHLRIDHSDLTALLYLQGYNVAEFATR